MTSESSVEILETADAVANRAAQAIAALAREAIEARGRFLFAVSGGHTPWVMLRALGAAEIPWPAVRIFQVDERVAPAGHADRNLTHLRESLLEHAPLAPGQILAMPVETEDLDRAAAEYAQTLQRECGSPAVLDLVHLGLGPDGHTASLVPGDPVLNVRDRDVAVTGPYQGRRRMTLTYPAINRARQILWVVTGAEKAQMLRRLLDCDAGIPGGRVDSGKSLVLADAAAIGRGDREA
jgi:6-phosphogluconolactonase